MIRGIPKKPGGNHTVTRPQKQYLGSEQIQPLEINQISPHEMNLRTAKLQYLENTNINLRYLENATDLQELAGRVVTELKILLDPRGERGVGMAFLVNRGAEYQAIMTEGLPVSIEELGLSRPNSVLRSATETKEALNRGTLYIPQLSGNFYYLGKCSDSYDRNVRGIEHNKHEVYLGSFDTFRKDLDRRSLAPLKSVAVVPIFKHSQTPPIGAIFLAGPEHFLDPVIDLMPLRVLSDQLARPLHKLTVQ